MSRLERWEPRSLFPDLFDWLESPVTMLRPGLAQAIRVENYVEDGRSRSRSSGRGRRSPWSGTVSRGTPGTPRRTL